MISVTAYTFAVHVACLHNACVRLACPHIGNDNDWYRGTAHVQLYADQLGFGVHSSRDVKFRWRAQPDIWYFISIS